jgi:hypothetical protein
MARLVPAALKRALLAERAREVVKLERAVANHDERFAATIRAQIALIDREIEDER